MKGTCLIVEFLQDSASSDVLHFDFERDWKERFTESKTEGDKDLLVEAMGEIVNRQAQRIQKEIYNEASSLKDYEEKLQQRIDFFYEN